MRQPSYGEHIGGITAHVGDCFVWAEIQYLDSPTDYREYLPTHHRQSVRIDSQLVMLDSVIPKPTFARGLFAGLRSVALIFLSIALAVGRL
jgi:hypothetical protein